MGNSTPFQCALKSRQSSQLHLPQQSSSLRRAAAFKPIPLCPSCEARSRSSKPTLILPASKSKKSVQNSSRGANEACQSMVQRGGGVRDLKSKILRTSTYQRGQVSNIPDMLVVEFQIDVCESMGANIVNTVAEHLAPSIVDLIGGRVGLKILSNLCSERRAISYFELPVKAMAWKQSSGHEVASKIIEAYLFAKFDIYRASTHNKGIFNGIDAVALATGQDWRAIEAAAHTYAFQSTSHNHYFGAY